MPSHEFTISVGDLDAAGKQYVFPVRAAWVRGALEGHEATTAGEDGVLDVRASKSGNDVVVHGTLKASLRLACARCLEPVTVPVDHPVSVLMVPRLSLGAPPRAKGGKGGGKRGEGEQEYEITEEEADTLPYDGETVVLDDLVRDELVLETPMIPLCSEDCPGIRTAPTENASPQAGVDPRLLPLMRFKSSPSKE